jgi:hypothetical protein
MQRGYKLAEKLRSAGYQAYPLNPKRQWLETNAEASYTPGSSWPPFRSYPRRKAAAPTGAQEPGLPVPDAMDFFEEVTEHKLLHGILPLKNIYAPAELNALAIAQVAWLAACHPDELRWGEVAGEGSEGRIALPDWGESNRHLDQAGPQRLYFQVVSSDGQHMGSLGPG